MSKEYPVTQQQLNKIKLSTISLGDGKKDKRWCCPFCLSYRMIDKNQLSSKDWRFNNFDKDKSVIENHMKTCSSNPEKIKEGDVNLKEWQRLFNNFDIRDNYTSPSKLPEAKFMMGKGYYHKGFSNIESDFYDLIQITHETEEAVLGAFVFGIGMFHVIWPKDQIRELTEEEVEEYHGKNIAISSNPAHASLNIKEHKFDRPITKQNV